MRWKVIDGYHRESQYIDVDGRIVEPRGHPQFRHMTEGGPRAEKSVLRQWMLDRQRQRSSGYPRKAVRDGLHRNAQAHRGCLSRNTEERTHSGLGGPSNEPRGTGLPTGSAG